METHHRLLSVKFGFFPPKLSHYQLRVGITTLSHEMMVRGVGFYPALARVHTKALRHDSPNKITKAHAGDIRGEKASF